MKAICTGFTASMTTGRSAVGFETLGHGIVRAINDAGHDCVMQPMRVETNDRDLAEADVMFFGLAPFNALGSRYLYGAIDALMKARANGVGVVCYVSDWQTNLITTSARAMVKKPEAFVKPLMQHRTDFEWARENLDYMMVAVNAFLEKKWPITLVPTHPWYDPNSKLVKHLNSSELVFLDPTVVTTRTWDPPEQKSPEDRSREWVLAALGDYSGWMQQQEFSWPVRYFGGKTFGAKKEVVVPDVPDAQTDDDLLAAMTGAMEQPIDEEAPKKPGPQGEGMAGGRNKRIKEAEVNANYAETWGGLSPKYMLSGSGWWRTRYDFILQAGGILYGPPEELFPMGDVFRQPLQTIESMTTEQLHALQMEQRASFYFETKEEVTEKIMDAARKAWVIANG